MLPDIGSVSVLWLEHVGPHQLQGAPRVRLAGHEGETDGIRHVQRVVVSVHLERGVGGSQYTSGILGWTPIHDVRFLVKEMIAK